MKYILNNFLLLIFLGNFKNSRWLTNFQDPGEMRIYGGWQIFRIQGDGLCWTMKFSRGFRPPRTLWTLRRSQLVKKCKLAKLRQQRLCLKKKIAENKERPEDSDWRTDITSSPNLILLESYFFLPPFYPCLSVSEHHVSPSLL